MTDVRKFAHGVTGLYNGGRFTNITAWGLPIYLELSGSKRKIYYNHNEYGFRGDHDPNCKRAAFGCSFTYGYELEEENTWPFLLKAKNYAVNGGSPQSVARLVEAWVPDSNLEDIFVLTPPRARREIYNTLTETYTQATAYNLNMVARNLKGKQLWDVEFDPDDLMEFLDAFPHLNVLDSEKNDQILEDCIDRIERACDGRNLVILQSDSSPQMPTMDNMSRDRTHGGDSWNRKVSQVFSRELEKLR